MKHAVLCALVLSGCWKTERSVLPESQVVFSPEAPAPEGWMVTEVEVDLRCPDGMKSRFYLVHPEESDGPIPTAVLYHSGSFDVVANPMSGDPISGSHLREPPRLEAPWAIRMANATLGMYPSPLPSEAHTGALPAALAERGIAMVLPANCWGDLWHNEPGTTDNSFEEDLFFRTGRAAAEWPWRLITEPNFSEALRIDVPFTPSPTDLFAIGLGEGGRGVGELLHIDDDEDGVSDYQPKAIVIDSSLDDLRALVASEPVAQAALERIFPGGDLGVGGIYSAPTLPPTAWIYSPVDPELPQGSQDAALARLGAGSGHLVLEQTPASHVFSNGDTDLAATVAEFLLP